MCERIFSSKFFSVLSVRYTRDLVLRTNPFTNLAMIHDDHWWSWLMINDALCDCIMLTRGSTHWTSAELCMLIVSVNHREYAYESSESIILFRYSNTLSKCITWSGGMINRVQLHGKLPKRSILQAVYNNRVIDTPNSPREGEHAQNDHHAHRI